MLDHTQAPISGPRGAQFVRALGAALCRFYQRPTPEARQALLDEAERLGGPALASDVEDFADELAKAAADG